MKTIKVGGVPEHFNLPWHLCIEEKLFETRGINVIWKDFPGGTDAMNKALRSGEIDVAVILTEGILKDIISGNESKIIQTYIGSPLVWGIHVAAGSKYKSVEELKHTKAAISRKGSGSHLMAYVNAQNHEWNTEELQFEIVKDLDGAVEALKEDKAQYFMWEHFTTKPLVDKGVFRRLGDCPTPWPCFMLVATQKFLEEQSAILGHIIEVINLYISEFKGIPSIDRTLANRYGQKLEDIQEWLLKTQWSQDQLDEKALDHILETLLRLELIDKKLPFRNYLA